MKEKKNININNVFYGVIGIATLMVAVMGATFAYFTASANNATTIIGNMATIDFELSVKKVTNADDKKGGLIPMSNNMMEQALTKNGICIDDNGNAVCQVYKITVNNTSSSSMFVDGYVSLTGGSGVPSDTPEEFGYAQEGPKDTSTATPGYDATAMRWAQAFCTAEDAEGNVTTCSTGNKFGNNVYSTLRTDGGAANAVEIGALGGIDTKDYGKNLAEIKFKHEDVTGDTSINGNTYNIINKNYIRLSKHATGNSNYTKPKTGKYVIGTHDDTTSALVYNQYLNAKDTDDTNNTGTSASNYTDSQVYYIVVWLSENGFDQTDGSGEPSVPAKDQRDNFFKGNVTFVTAQGSEVTATFTGLNRVTPNT